MKDTLKAIRTYCLLVCQGLGAGSPEPYFRDVRECGDTECPLWAYRLGTNPTKAPSRVAAGKRVAAIRWAKALQSRDPSQDDQLMALIGDDPDAVLDALVGGNDEST